MLKSFFYSIFRSSCNIFAGSGFGKNFLIARAYHIILPLVSPKQVKLDDKIFFLDKGDSLALSVFPDYEPAVAGIIRNEVKSGMRVLDIGAHIGYFTLMLADQVGPKGKVYAFEPNPESFRILQKNIKENKYKNIIAVNAAASEKKGKKPLFIGSKSSAEYSIYNYFQNERKIQVNSWSIDEYFTNKNYKVDFVKIDIQGAEGRALLGMEKTIKKNPQIKLLTEFWPVGLDKSEVGARGYLHILKSLGFNFSIVRDKIVSIRKQISVEEVLKDSKKYGYINIFCFRY